jgi:multiple sugar transport system permease protein
VFIWSFQNEWKIFYKIAMPMCKSPLILSMLFSLVWYWNEISQSSMFFGETFKTLPMRLQQFQANYEARFGAAAGFTSDAFNDAILMAGTLLSILPILIFYLLSQKQFVQSIERSGITGE